MKPLRFALTLAFVVMPGTALAADGMLRPRKLPSDAVVAPPAAETYEKLPKDVILAPEHMRPGTHTLTFEVARSLPQGQIRRFTGSVDCVPWHQFKATGEVGWGEIEWGDGPCTAIVFHLAVLFDRKPLDAIPTKTIDRVVLTYDEAPGFSCAGWVYQESATCWQNGEGVAEPKPDGCAVVRVPTVDWTQNDPPALIPFATAKPAVRRVSTREWDVTEPYTWQNVQGAAPLGASPTFGFLLTGSITSTDDLEGEDDTICVSTLTNIRLLVTYTVPEPSGPPDVVR
jgi:hypothetical protein